MSSIRKKIIKGSIQINRNIIFHTRLGMTKLEAVPLLKIRDAYRLFPSKYVLLLTQLYFIPFPTQGTPKPSNKYYRDPAVIR